MSLQNKAIKQRIKSVRNTKKVTKAMELVAASKMRKAVSKNLEARTYAHYSLDVIRSLRDHNAEHPLFKTRADGKTLALIVTSNRGLCGAFNAQVIRAALGLLKEKKEHEQIDFVTVGRKGDTALRRVGASIVASFEGTDGLDVTTIAAIEDLVTDRFLASEYQKVLIIYTDYVSVLVQKPIIRQLLPFTEDAFAHLLTANDTKDARGDFVFEPARAEVVRQIVDRIIRLQIYTVLLESNASEQSARMIAMKNASEAAEEMVEDLVLMFNKVRQAGITQEISEISASMVTTS